MDGAADDHRETLIRTVATLRQDVKASELYWSLFATALFHYKVDSLLRPFPPAFVRPDGEKDVERLRCLCESLPSIRDVLSSRWTTLTDEQSSLLCWVFRSGRPWSLESRDVAVQTVDLRKLTGEHMPASRPCHLFEVSYDSAAEERFDRLRGDRKLLHAYHGSRAENFYSILACGLQSTMNTRSLFGEGTYLSSELAVAVEFSPLVPARAAPPRNGLDSNGGSDEGRLSVVALCELIDDPNGVKCDRRTATPAGSSGGSGSIDSRVSARAPNSQAGDVPEKYYVVTNSDLIRVKYLLVYTAEPSAVSSAVMSQSSSSSNSSSQWANGRRFDFAAAWRRHSFAVTMLLYGLLLLCIGLMSSKRFWSRIRQLYRQASNILDLPEWQASGDL